MRKFAMGAAVMLACACGMSMNVQAETLVTEENITTLSPNTVLGNDENGIPDKALYEWLLDNADYDGSGDLTIRDLEQLDYMMVYDTTQMRSLEGIQYCINLERVYLDGQSHCENPITDFSPLAGLTKLKTLELAYANITDISFLTDLVNLTHLSLSGNQITDISPLAGMTRMETLWLDYNQVSDISALAGMTKLETLGLRDNRVISTAPLVNATEMYYLDLGENQITDLSGLSQMTNLDELDLTENQITDISSLAGIKQVRNLLLGQNQITNVSSLTGFTKLETLRLDENQITDISSLQKSTEIYHLFLGGNKISDISKLAYMPKITWLEINDNQISNIRAVVAMKQLTSLNASNNQISDIGPLSVLENIAELNLDNNQIVDVSPLSGYQALNLLLLAHNQIADPSPLESLSEIRDLNLVDLSYNQITDVSGISGLRAKGVVNLYGNPYELPRSELKTMYEDFVGRRYYALVDEWIPEQECNYWVEALLDKEIGAVQLVENLLQCDAFRSRQLNDEEYVCAMYMCITDYWPETEELEEWLAALAAGKDRQALVNALLESDGFASLCKDYYVEISIEPQPGGDDEDPDDPVGPQDPERPDGAEENVRAFVTRMYTVALDREAESSGVNYWTELLLGGKTTGGDVAKGFFLGGEFVGRNLSDEKYVEVLYATFFDREADEKGLDYYKELLSGDKVNGRNNALDIFIKSGEFDKLCSSYGITAFLGNDQQVKQFVERMYTVALNRPAETSGVNYWTELLLNGGTDAEDVARGFFTGEEFIKRALNDESYVKTLYATFFDRVADAEGLQYNMGLLASNPADGREKVFDVFASSEEFKQLCESYGIKAMFTQEELVRGFVERMYTVALNRAAEEGGASYWTNELLAGKTTGAQVAQGFICGDEFKGRGLNDRDYVITLYGTFFNREASEEDIAYWAAKAAKDRDVVLVGFANSDEFANLCKNYGIPQGSIQ